MEKILKNIIIKSLTRLDIFYKTHRLVRELLKRDLNKLHTYSVLNLFVNEMIKELKSGKSINIPNFGKFIVKRQNQRNVWSIVSRKIMPARRLNVLRIVISKKLRKAILKELNECEEKKE